MLFISLIAVVRIIIISIISWQNWKWKLENRKEKNAFSLGPQTITMSNLYIDKLHLFPLQYLIHQCIEMPPTPAATKAPVTTGTQTSFFPITSHVLPFISRLTGTTLIPDFNTPSLRWLQCRTAYSCGSLGSGWGAGDWKPSASTQLSPSQLSDCSVLPSRSGPGEVCLLGYEFSLHWRSAVLIKYWTCSSAFSALWLQEKRVSPKEDL